MRAKHLVCLGIAFLTASSVIWGQPAAPQKPMFRSSQNLILVDVTVRDKKGQQVDGLTAADFEVLENGKPQEVVSFAHEKVAPSTTKIVTASTLSKAGEEKGAVPVTLGSAKAGAPKPAAVPPAATGAVADAAAATIDASAMPLTSDAVAGHRVDSAVRLRARCSRKTCRKPRTPRSSGRTRRCRRATSSRSPRSVELRSSPTSRMTKRRSPRR